MLLSFPCPTLLLFSLQARYYLQVSAKICPKLQRHQWLLYHRHRKNVPYSDLFRLPPRSFPWWHTVSSIQFKSLDQSVGYTQKCLDFASKRRKKELPKMGQQALEILLRISDGSLVYLRQDSSQIPQLNSVVFWSFLQFFY